MIDKKMGNIDIYGVDFPGKEDYDSPSLQAADGRRGGRQGSIYILKNGSSGVRESL